MAEEITPALRAERTAAMRALDNGARYTAIDASTNVVGADRFADRARQVQLRQEYQRTFQGQRP